MCSSVTTFAHQPLPFANDEPGDVPVARAGEPVRKLATRTVAFALLVSAALPLWAQAQTGSTRFIPTFVVYYGGGPALVASDAQKLAKFDLINTNKYRYSEIAPNTWAAVKAYNPGVQIYLYANGIEASNFQDAVPQVYLNELGRYGVPRGHPQGSLNGDNPALFQLDSLGKRIYNAGASNAGANQYSYLMDFGNAAYQSYWLTAIKADIVDQPWLADGVFADSCLTAPNSGGYSRYSAAPAWYSTNTAWSAAMNAFANAITSGLRGYGQKLWCNRGDTRSAEGAASWLALDQTASPPDVLFEDGAFAVMWGAAVQFYPESDWKRQVDILAAIKNSRVAMHSHTQLAEGQTGTDNYGKPVGFWQTLWYSLGSFLLGRNDALGNAYFAFGGNYNKIAWYDEYDKINLGKAVGPYRVSAIGGVNIYSREFEKGYVYVNPTPYDVPSVTLPRASRQLTHDNLSSAPDSIASVNAIALNSHNAAILLKADTTAPSIPGGLTAAAVSPTQVDLAWTASTDNVGVAGYYVYRDGVQVASVSATTHSSTGLAAGTSYSFAVAAYDAAGNVSAKSNAVSAATPALASSPYTGTPFAIPGSFEAENFDRGGEGVAYHDNVKGNSGRQYRTSEDVDIVTSTDPLGGGYVVNNFETGEWLAYTVNVASSAQYDIELRVSSMFATGAFHVEIDGKDVTGAVTVPNTGGWSIFQWVGKKGVALTAGRHVLKIVARQQYFNLNSVRVARTTSSPYGGTPVTLPGSFEAEDFDLGGEGFGYHDNVKGNSGGQYRTSEDVDIVASTDPLGGGYVVNNFETGEWLAYTVNVASSAQYDIELRVSSMFATGAFHVEIDGKDVTGAVTVPNTGGWSIFQWVGKKGVALTAGRHVLKIVARQQYFDLNSVRVVAPGGSTGSADPGAVNFLCSFVNLPTDCGFSEQGKVSGRASIVSIGRDGATAVRLHTEPGDNYVAGSGDAERNDLTTSQANTDGYEGREHWWAHSVLFPSDYVDPPESTTTTWNWQVVFDFHATGNVPGTVANFQVEAMPKTAISPDRPTGLRFRGYGGDPAREFTAPIGPVVRNTWYDFVYHVKWSSGTDGFFDAWVNGKKMLSYRGPTLYPGQGVYLKLANYHTPYGQANSVIHDRVVRGTTALSVSTGPLEGVLELVNGVLTPVLQ